MQFTNIDQHLTEISQNWLKYRETQIPNISSTVNISINSDIDGYYSGTRWKDECTYNSWQGTLNSKPLWCIIRPMNAPHWKKTPSQFGQYLSVWAVIMGRPRFCLRTRSKDECTYNSCYRHTNLKSLWIISNQPTPNKKCDICKIGGFSL